MRRSGPCVRTVLLIAAAASALAQPRRITTSIDNSRRASLGGHVHPKARAEFDRGRVAPSLDLKYVTLTLAQTEAQKAGLARLLADQQTPGSPDYHRWLTPEQYADRFGVSAGDIDEIGTWLESQGLEIAAVARGRNWIAVNGTAAQIEAAFRTELHRYEVNGEMHFANATEPSVPAALSGMVRSIHGLNNFRMHPQKRHASPQYTSAKGNHYLAPNDLATIYNIQPLFDAGIDGTGQSLVIAGQTQINLADVQSFRSRFNLPPSTPNMILVPNSTDPGVVSGDEDEAHLDIEWSGAVARNASIIYVYSSDVMESVQYAIDQNLAPVISTSYGSCEPETPSSDAAAFRAWAQQANAQGITWISASGDSGGADCDDARNPGLSVDIPASIPEVTAIGGTEFSEGSGQYWGAMNDSNGASVTSYVPEVAWNDSALVGEAAASGGGPSMYFLKPSWQTAAGVPSDNARHVPDISMNASADHDGYLVYTGGALAVYGGTSVPTPVFAGVTALLNQFLVSKGSNPGLGNVNPALYALAGSSPQIFHDITGGDNIVTASCPRRLTCTNTPVGFSAGAGYDDVTGLGSIDANLLLAGWGTAVSAKSTATISLSANLSSFGVNDTVYLMATVTGAAATPAGAVVFSVNGVQLGSAPLAGSAGSATATLAVNGSAFASGLGTVTAVFNSASASLTVSVAAFGSGGAAPAISALTNGASYQQAFAPGGVLTIWGSQLAKSTQSAGAVPLPLSMDGTAVLINGVAAPLYYVSPGLVNVQIPYEISPGGATLSINNNGQVSTRTFAVASAGPGIFIDPTGGLNPTSSAARGQQIALYITGAGAISPAVSSGAAPPASTPLNSLPKPTQPARVTVGNQPAAINFIGIPPGLVGVVQINITVPAGIAVGQQAVVVTIGEIASASARLTVTN